eukprot:scaffold27777_cov129-Isochrysis_galbana.AAC.2
MDKAAQAHTHVNPGILWGRDIKSSSISAIFVLLHHQAPLLQESPLHLHFEVLQRHRVSHDDTEVRLIQYVRVALFGALDNGAAVEVFHPLHRGPGREAARGTPAASSRALSPDGLKRPSPF